MATVLVVDDNPLYVRLISEILKHLGDQAVSTALGQCALELAWRKSPDLVIVDHFLPDMLGTEVVRRFRNDVRMAKIPIIATSAWATEGEIGRMIQLGCDDYLPKPIGVAAVMGVMDSVRNRAFNPSDARLARGPAYRAAV